MLLSPRNARSLALSVLVSATLVVGYAVPAYGDETPPVRDAAPVLKSDALNDPASVTPAGEFVAPSLIKADPALFLNSARLKPVYEGEPGFDPERSVLDHKTEDSNVFRNPDGSFTAQVSLEDINVEVDGEWLPSSTRLRATGDGGYAVPQNPLAPEFAGAADDPELFSASNEGYTVTFGLRGADGSRVLRPARAAEGADLAVYPEVFDGVDLEYDVDKGQVKETLILKELPSAEESSWVFTVHAPGLTVAENALGNIELTDRRGRVVFVIPDPVMWDSSGKEGIQEAALVNVDTVIAREGDDWTLTLNADHEWLSDPARVYPVFVDPYVNDGGSSIEAYKSDGAHLSGIIRVGNSRDGGTNKYWRTVLHYNYSGAAGKQVTGGELQVGYSSGTVNGYVSNIYTAGCYGYSCAYAYVIDMWVTTSGDTGVVPQLGAVFAPLVNASAWGQCFLLTGQETPGAYSYKALGSMMYVTYVDYPSVAAAVSPSPANNGTGPLAPTLKVTGVDPAGVGLEYQYVLSTNANPDIAPVYTSNWSSNAELKVPQTSGLLPNTKYYWKAKVRYSPTLQGLFGTDTTRSSAVWSFTTNAPAPAPAQSSAVPTDGEVVTSLTPTLATATSTDPDSSSNPVTYQFHLASGANGRTGALASSGWLSAPSWTLPAGLVQDGGSYTWWVETDDGAEHWESAWVNTLKVNLRLGASGPSPFESSGPVTVNLANGNVNLEFTSPTVSTVGGDMGMAFSYNSLKSPTQFHGLTASYFDAGQTTPTYTFPGKTPVLVRNDAQVSFDWASGSAGPAVPANNFLARWNGYIQVPTSGSYTFGVVRDDGAKVTVGNSVVYNQWTSTQPVGTQWGSSLAMTTTPTEIQVEYYESTGSAKLELWVQPPTGGPFIVPTDWFTRSFQTLPAGWGTSTPIAGSGGTYVSAAVSEASVALTDVSGGVHTYMKKTAGGYSPPAGEYGVLSLDAMGLVVLTDENGTVHVFNAQGKLVSATKPTDALKPSTPLVTFRSSTGQADRISDRLSASIATPVTYDREVRFAYAGDGYAAVGLSLADSNVSGTACPVLPGYSATPAGMLCRIVYPGHVAGSNDTTRLLYNSAGQLAGIIDPGGETTTFAYDSNGRLDTIVDSLANDWLVANPSVTPGSNQATTISYDSAGRAVSVTLPAPDGVTTGDRPSKTYDYSTTPNTTYVDVAGLTLGSGQHAKTVTYDSAWRQLTVASPSGLTASRTWSNKDQVLSTTNAQGSMSTLIYNAQGRATESYGPAPVSCFGSDRRPLATCPILPAHGSTSYDAGLKGLHAAYYGNEFLSGSPRSFDLFNSTGDGSLSRDWGTGSPVVGMVDAWSARFTGLITFPVAGTYSFATYADDATRVWVDDVLVVDSWNNGALRLSTSAVPIPVTANQQARIRVEYSETNSTANLELRWNTTVAPTYIKVPGTALSPDYGLANGTLTEDSVMGIAGLSDSQVPDMVTAVEYTHPWLGAPTASIVDPGSGSHLNLRTETTYESPAPGGFYPGSGVAIGTGWGVYKQVLSPGDFTGDGKPDLIAVQTDGVLKLFAGDGVGGYGTGTQIGTSWQQFTSVLTPGDWNKDGKNDLIGWATNGYLYLYLGNGTGGFIGGGTQIGSGWTFRTILTPGDFNGDGNVDLIAVTTAGALVLYPGNGAMGFTGNYPQIGTGWQGYSFVVAAGDFTGDGKPDVLGALPDGTLKAHAGTGTGGVAATGAVIGTGWAGIKSIIGPGNFSGPGQADLLAVTTPGQLNLFTGDSPGWQRRLAKRMPSAVAMGAPAATAGLTLTYWGDKQQLGSSICGLAATTPQSGFLKASTSPTPATGTAVTTEFVYDLFGRKVGTKRSGDTTWTCNYFDSRGRTTSTVLSAFGGAPARTVTNDHAVGGNPLVSSGTDSVGTVTVTIDLLGRTVTSTDVWGTTTTSAYESRTGQLLSSTTTIISAGSTTQLFTYNVDGQVLTVTSGAVTATATYAGGLLQRVDYSNGTSLTDLTRDAAGAGTGFTWDFASGDDITDSVVRSQSGRIVQNTLTDGVVTETSTYSFDAAGRLVRAVIPRHELTYEFAGSGTCGANTAAGRNGNRTGFTDLKDDGEVTETTSTMAYCYDNADRLTATTPTNASGNAAPVSESPLTTVGPGATLAYDSHGNTTTLADQTITYDASDQHLTTTVVGGPTITYLRDVTGSIVQRTSVEGTITEVVRYTTGAVLDGNGAVLQRTQSLPGGASRTDDGTTVKWFYPNLHGDVIVRADDSGTRVGARATFDPFGQPIDPVTGEIGTDAADEAILDTTPSDADLAFVGGHGKLYEHGGTIATIEMGARQYVAALGRFLEVDPVEGGVSNAYDYPADPINKLDLSGEFIPLMIFAIIAIAAVVLMIPSSTQQPPSPGPHNPFPFPNPTPAGTGRGGPDPCANGGCTSNKVSVPITCSGSTCFTLAFAFREDKHVFAEITVAKGLGSGTFVAVGTSTGDSEGVSFGASCAGAYGLGVYGEAGFGVYPLPASNLGLSESSPFGSGAGFTFGLGAECSAGFTFSFDITDEMGDLGLAWW